MASTRRSSSMPHWMAYARNALVSSVPAKRSSSSRTAIRQAMAVSEPTILEAIARYQREYDRYLKLCSRVAEICRSEIIEGNAMRAQVTFRAKSPKSLENKLRRYRAGSKDMSNVDSVFEQVRDLAAVRIATYEQNVEKKVSAALYRRFIGNSGADVTLDVRDKRQNDPGNFYRATHFEVYLPSPDLIGTYANVDGVPCEIQVCSMMAHVIGR